MNEIKLYYIFTDFTEKTLFKLPQWQQDTGNRKDLKIENTSCFSDLSDSLNLLNSLNFFPFRKNSICFHRIGMNVQQCTSTDAKVK